MSFSKSICILVALTITAVYGQQKPSFCKKYDCPVFTSQDMTGYEIRTYNQTTNWVGTSVITTNPDNVWTDGRSMFMKLFGYINGNNEAALSTEMTLPVLTRVESLPGNMYNVTMLFYQTSSTPPTPTDPEVFLTTRPPGEVFVSQFREFGWATYSDYAKAVSGMKSAIADPSLYNDNVYYKTGYDGPFTLGKRLYEVWVDKI